MIKSIPSLIPVAVFAEHGKICHERSRIEYRFNPLDSSWGDKESRRSCLFA